MTGPAMTETQQLVDALANLLIALEDHDPSSACDLRFDAAVAQATAEVRARRGQDWSAEAALAAAKEGR